MIEARRLKHAPGAMIKVGEEREHGDDIEGRYIPNAKPSRDVVVHRTFVKVRMDGPGCKMKQMIDDEYADQRSGPSHRARRKVGPHRAPSFISGGLTLLAHPGQLKSGDDVQDHCEEKYCACGPEQTRIRFQKGGIRINFCRTTKH